MDFIILGSTIFIILLIIRLYNYYNPSIDIVCNEHSKSIVLWYSTYEENIEIRNQRTLITF